MEHLRLCHARRAGQPRRTSRRFDAQDDDPFARRRLSARVRPFLLRRTKSQVAKDLPDRVEEDLFCEMEGEQKTLYRAELKRAQQLLPAASRPKRNSTSSASISSPRCCACARFAAIPRLVNAELRQAESAKVNALLDLLEPLMEEGHKVLVFSQFVSMLDLLRETVKAARVAAFLSGRRAPRTAATLVRNISIRRRAAPCS